MTREIMHEILDRALNSLKEGEYAAAKFTQLMQAEQSEAYTRVCAERDELIACIRSISRQSNGTLSGLIQAIHVAEDTVYRINNPPTK